MTVKLLLSQPAGGKTSFCIEKIRRIRLEDPLAPVKVIVPDGMQMAYWKQTLARKSPLSNRGSGFIGTEIISFAKLAMEILGRSDRAPLLIPARLNTLCIRDALGKASQKEPLLYFEPIREKPGLVSLFEQTFRDLLHSCVTPEMLEETAGGEPKALDTARVFREYLGILKEHNWVGSAGLLTAAAEHLGQDPDAFSGCPLLVADGFSELDKDCREFLRALSPFCAEILITLPANPHSDDPSDQRILKNAALIRTELGAELISPEGFSRNSEILRLADRVFYPPVGRHASGMRKMSLRDDSFLMIEASSRTTEVREALRELKRRVLESQKHPSGRIRPGDCAVFVPDMNAYAPIFRQFGREMGIPLRFSRKQPLSESPAASALKRLLRLYPDFDTMKLISVLRLPFLSGRPDPDDPSGGGYGADLFVIDRIGRKMNVISGTEQWVTAFSEAIRTSEESRDKKKRPDDASEEGKVYEYPEPEKMKRIRDSFLKFIAMITPAEGQKARSEWVGWLENLLSSIRFYEQIKDKSRRSFEADFRALLKRIVFCEDRLGQPAVSWEDFRAELESEMDAAVQTEQEFAADRIFVGDIGRIAGSRWKLIVLTGFAEGIFPRAERENLILTGELRDRLGMPAAMDQHLLFHHALTRSAEGLVITHPRKTDKGEEWPASIYWQTVRDNLEEKANLLTVTENMAVAAASADEFVFRLARGGRETIPEGMHLSAPDEIRAKLETARDEMDRLREQNDGRYSPETDPLLKKALADPAKDALPFSCSAIETWLTCPFKYFLMKKLKLEQPQEPGRGMDAAQVGTMNHTVMELTFPAGTVYASKEEALEKAGENITRVFATAPQDFGFTESELWEYEKEKYRQKLLDSIEKMFDDGKTKMPVNGSWMSVGAELEFGYPEKGRDNAAPLTVETSAGPLRIRGIIDRVDRRNDGMLRVVDYKTGLPSFSKAELEAGSHIQAGVYAAAVVHALRLGPKCEGMYWSINYGSVKGYMLYDPQNDQKFPNIEFLNRFAEGIRDAAYPADPAGGTCPDYCPAAPWCRKYVRRQFYG